MSILYVQPNILMKIWITSFFVLRKTLEVIYAGQIRTYSLSTSVKVKQIAYTGCGGLGKLTEGKNNIR